MVDAMESFVIMEPWMQKKMYPMMILETMITSWKNYFCRLQRESRNFVTFKMEFFMTIDKGYILDMTRFLGLSLEYAIMLFIGLVLCKKIFYITGSIFVRNCGVKSIFNVFEIIRRMCMLKYQYVEVI